MKWAGFHEKHQTLHRDQFYSWQLLSMTYGISRVLSFQYLGLIFQLVTFQLLLLILLGCETYYSHKQSNYPYSPELHSRVLWTILCYPLLPQTCNILKMPLLPSNPNSGIFIQPTLSNFFPPLILTNKAVPQCSASLQCSFSPKTIAEHFFFLLHSSESSEYQDEPIKTRWTAQFSWSSSMNARIYTFEWGACSLDRHRVDTELLRKTNVAA